MRVGPSGTVNDIKIQLLLLEELPQQYIESKQAKVKCISITTHLKGKVSCLDYGMAMKTTGYFTYPRQSNTEDNTLLYEERERAIHIAGKAPDKSS